MKGVSPPDNKQQKPWYKVWPSHLPYSLDYPDVPVWWILEHSVSLFPNRDAVIFLDYKDMSEIGRLSYAELYTNAKSISAGLRKLGIQKGERVATVLPNSPALIQSYYGVWLAGATMVPCNTMAKTSELRKTFADSNVKAVITSELTFPDVRQAAEELKVQIVVASLAGTTGPDLPLNVFPFENLLNNREYLQDFTIQPGDDVAAIIYTGGTTGEPKGAMLTHRNIVINTVQFAEWYAFEPGMERCVCVIPMSHSGGMSGVMNVPLYAGATLLVMERANPPIIGKVVEKYRATRLFGVPTLYTALLNDKEASNYDYSSLRACRSGAASLPVQVKKAFDSLSKKEVLVEAYGLTETSPVCVANPIDRPKAGSIGIPLPDTDAKIVDIDTREEVPPGHDGELLIRGPQVMKGYLNKPEATKGSIQDGWLRTGDVACMDDEGYFFIVDRLKDFINASGFKVWPREVEEVLYKYPGVKLASVIGIPDSYRGESVKAFIVPTDEAKDCFNADDLTAHCRKHLSSYKVPRLIEFRRELPTSPAGKIMRRLLKEEEHSRE